MFEGRLKNIVPERLIDINNQDDFEDFFLTFGLFYNDLKNISFHILQVENAFKDLDKKDFTPRPNFGEYTGIKNHLDRLLAAMVYEFFEFIKENMKTIEDERFKMIYETLNRDLKDKWDLIKKIASHSSTNDDSDFSKILMLIRNNVAFHYFQSAKNLRKGYSKYFFEDEKNGLNERAYYSVGETMEDTRFFFSDAAVTNFIMIEVTKKMEYNKYIGKLSSVIKDLNFTIMALLKTYISGRPYK